MSLIKKSFSGQGIFNTKWTRKYTHIGNIKSKENKNKERGEARHTYIIHTYTYRIKEDSKVRSIRRSAFFEKCTNKLKVLELCKFYYNNIEFISRDLIKITFLVPNNNAG